MSTIYEPNYTETVSRAYPKGYHNDLANFLEEVDYGENGPPAWVFDYYLGGDDLYDDLYNKWQCLSPGVTDGIQFDGDQHLEEYQLKVVHCETPHCQVVSGCESTPWQEPHHLGAPIHCSYIQVKVPFNELPQDIPPGYEMVSNWNGHRVGQDDIIPMIIGRGGDFMKQLTQDCGLHYIWYNKNPMGYEDATREDGVFELWGLEYLLPKAAYRLYQHIQNTIDGIWRRENERMMRYENDYQDEGESYSDVEEECETTQPVAHYELPIRDYVANWDNEVLDEIINREWVMDTDIEGPMRTRQDMIDIIDTQLFTDITHDRMSIFGILNKYKHSFYYDTSSGDDSCG
jgi:hypothetical protein